MALLRVLGLVTIGVAFVPLACRSKPAPEAPDAGSPSAEAPAAPPVDEGEGGTAYEPFVEAGNRFRDAEPRAETDPDGPVDPACVGGGAGAEVSFATAVIDKRCAIGSARAKQLTAILERDGGPRVPLRQEAKVLPDGRIAVRLVNTGSSALMLPLSFSAKLPAFTVLAEDDRKALYELEPPLFDVDGGASPANERAHFARIVLAPGGAAVATIAVQPGIARVLGRRGGARADASVEPAPTRLTKGRYVLHVGELLADVDAGDPARVRWELP